MKYKLLLAVLLVACSIFLPYSNVFSGHVFSPCRPGAKVIFINGVFNFSEQDALDSRAQLEESVPHFGVSCVAEVSHLYNPSVLLGIDDLREAAFQKATELGITFGDAFLQVGLAVFGAVSSLSQSDQDQIRARVAARIQSITLSTAVGFASDGTAITTASLVNEFRDRVRTELGQGTKTILVAHSQGNFFANAVYTAVQATTPASVAQGLAIVNVANASINAPTGLWVTAKQDLVIIALGSLALPWNFDALGAYSYDLSGHGFGDVYLNRGLPTGASETNSIAAKVMELLQQALNVAQPPVATILGSTSFNLFSLNLATNTASVLGSFAYSNSPPIAVWDVATNPRGGPGYAISASGVYTLDLVTRSLLRLPQSVVGGNALAFNADGELYGMGGNKIFRFDLATGVATDLPMTLGTHTSSGDLTFDGDGILFGTARATNGVDSLIRIDLNRSTLTFIGSTGYSGVYGLYFSGGYLYGVTSSGALLNIDRSTGVAQPVRQLPFGDITGLQ